MGALQGATHATLRRLVDECRCGTFCCNCVNLPLTVLSAGGPLLLAIFGRGEGLEGSRSRFGRNSTTDLGRIPGSLHMNDSALVALPISLV